MPALCSIIRLRHYFPSFSSIPPCGGWIFRALSPLLRSLFGYQSFASDDAALIFFALSFSRAEKGPKGQGRSGRRRGRADPAREGAGVTRFAIASLKHPPAFPSLPGPSPCRPQGRPPSGYATACTLLHHRDTPPPPSFSSIPPAGAGSSGLLLRPFCVAFLVITSLAMMMRLNASSRS